MNVLFFAFANSPIPGQFLPKLEEEEGYINQALSKRQLAGEYLMIIESFANLHNISKALQQYQDNLTWFHYSGHAEKHQLLLKDQTVEGKGIIQMLKQCPNLKGVVLNGCSTQWQAAELREAGIPIVIGTSSPVEDSKATNFSGGFYNMLSMNKTVSKAFETAIGAAMAGGDIEIFRGSRPPGKIKKKPLWGLLSENEDALNLKIPFGGESVEELKDRLRNLVIDDLGKAISELGAALKDNSRKKDDYILQSARYRKNNSPSNIAASYPQDIRMVNAQIMQGILSIIGDIKEEDLV